jgi:hypothetical protein
MTMPLPSKNIPERMLQKTGGLYIVLSLAFAQVISTPLIIILAGFMLAINAELTNTQMIQLAGTAAGVLVLRNILLLIYGYRSSLQAVTSLKESVKEPASSNKDASRMYEAWKQITTLPWRYSGFSLASLLVFVLPVLAAYLLFILKSSTNQIYYLVFAQLQPLVALRYFTKPPGSRLILTGDLTLCPALRSACWLNSLQPLLPLS